MIQKFVDLLKEYSVLDMLKNETVRRNLRMSPSG